jgi:hypothetical protein
MFLNNQAFAEKTTDYIQNADGSWDRVEICQRDHISQGVDVSFTKEDLVYMDSGHECVKVSDSFDDKQVKFSWPFPFFYKSAPVNEYYRMDYSKSDAGKIVKDETLSAIETTTPLTGMFWGVLLIFVFCTAVIGVLSKNSKYCYMVFLVAMILEIVVNYTASNDPYPYGGEYGYGFAVLVGLLIGALSANFYAGVLGIILGWMVDCLVNPIAVFPIHFDKGDRFQLMVILIALLVATMLISLLANKQRPKSVPSKKHA